MQTVIDNIKRSDYLTINIEQQKNDNEYPEIPTAIKEIKSNQLKQ